MSFAKSLQIWLLAALALTLSACSTQPLAASPAPRQIDPPPISLTTACEVPAPLPGSATAQDLSVWALGWVGTAKCEATKRAALVAAWPL